MGYFFVDIAQLLLQSFIRGFADIISLYFFIHIVYYFYIRKGLFVLVDVAAHQLIGSGIFFAEFSQNLFVGFVGSDVSLEGEDSV